MNNRFRFAFWFYLDSLNTTILGNAARYVMSAPQVIAIGRNIDRYRRDNQIRFTEFIHEIPGAGVIELRWWQKVVRVAQRGTLVNPGDYGVYLFLFKSPISLQILDTDTMVVCVGGHFAISDHNLDKGSPGTNLIIGFELHWTDTAFAMTDYTILINDSASLTVVGYRFFIILRMGKHGAKQGCS